jgi:hypothetical protein
MPEPSALYSVMGAMSLYHLIYESQATRPFSEAELANLLQQARRFNEANGITGLLLYTPDGYFLQVLEGSVEAVHNLYFLHIARDSRHHSLTLLAGGTLNHRRFADWRMGFRTVTAEGLTNLTGYLNTTDITFLLPLLPNLSNSLLDKILDHVQYTTPDPVLEEAAC